MSQTDRIREIIGAHRGASSGALHLTHAIRARLGDDADEAGVQAALGLCHDLIDAVPTLLDHVRAVLQDNGAILVLEPMLAHAEAYFIEPSVLRPGELGELGLIDGTYLVLSVIRMLQTDEDPVVDIDLDTPLSFLGHLLGDEILARLQEERAEAARHMVSGLEQLEALQELVGALEGLGAERAESSAQPQPSAQPQQPGVLEQYLAASGPTPRTTPLRPVRSQPMTTAPRRCGMCSGTGTTTCSSCGGMGSHTVSSSRSSWDGGVEYYTDYIPCGCSGGRSTCGACGGSGYAR